MTFPTTSILDNFNRANEGPPPSASWSAWNAFFSIPEQLVVSGNACKSNTALDTGSDWWNASTPGPDCEVYATLSNWPTLGVGDGMGVSLLLRLVGQDTAGPTFSYYMLSVNQSYGSSPAYTISRVTEAGTSILKSGTVTIATGDAIGMDRVGDTLAFHRKPSGGSWTSVDSVTDGSPLSAVAGRLALSITPDAGGLLSADDFGGGNPPATPVANFSGTPLAIQVGQSVTFTDLSTNTPTSWSWDFGDGGSDTVQNPVHQYNTAGVYTVSLTATNASGSDGETKLDYITVIQINDPTLLVATASAYNQIDLRWVDNADNESGYSIERSDNGTTGWAEIDTVAADVVTYSDTTVTAGQTKYYRVRAYKIV